MLKTPRISLVLAKNLKDAIERQTRYPSITALGKASKVAPTSIGYMLNPETRQPSKSGKMPTPTLETIDAVARALKMQAWQLIYPDPEKMPMSDRQQDLLAKIEADLAELRALDEKK